MGTISELSHNLLFEIASYHPDTLIMISCLDSQTRNKVNDIDQWRALAE